MVPDFIPLYSVIIVLFSLIYFACASIPFLFVSLDVPEVARLFRGLFDVYFWMVGGTALLATVAFAASGRIAYAVAMLLLAVTAIVVRKKVLQRIDTQQDALQAGDAGAMRRLRLIHWGGMLANIAILVSLAGSMTRIL
ncbi:MAG TPA: hypothetical protein VJR30_25210 [Bradyrhizobium sp.]|nr:hypothetical protein [Bradyrhizobium sp.]